MVKRRSALFCVPALVAGMLVTVAQPAGAGLPGGATKVVVTSGADAGNIDGHLHGAASIAGDVTGAGAGTLSGIAFLYLNGTNVRTSFFTGSYYFGGLTASATGYAVCVSGNTVSGGNSPTGYLGRCYMTSPFNGINAPAGADLVTLTDQQQRAGININLPSAAAIRGRITNAGGSGIRLVGVTAKNRSTNATFHGASESDGTYRIDNLPPSAKGYSVCAKPFGDAGSTGYRPRCFDSVPWSGNAIPAGATKVSATVGQVTSGVNVRLAKGAAISGKVSDASNGNPLPGSEVVVFSSTDRVLASTSTNVHGIYAIKGLAASPGNQVCVQPRAGSTPGVNYKGECWNNAGWNGRSAPPSGADKVSTATGHTHTGINFKLTKVTTHLGAISGTISTQVDSHPLQNASVTLYDSSGAFVTNTLTDESGTFHFDNIYPSALGYRVCAQAENFTFAPALAFIPTGGWAPRCYVDVAWNGLAAPSGAKIPISPGQHQGGVNFALHPGGSISGEVFEFGGSTPVSNAAVNVYTPSGTLLAQGFSGVGNGLFTILNLPPSATGYLVCFDGRDAGFQLPNYLPQCWQDQPWNGST
jgi:hypothetical protein